MKKIINGKIYNTETMKTIIKIDVFANVNFDGSDSIRITRNGNYAFVQTSNGHDCYRNNNIEAITKNNIADLIDGWDISEKEEDELKKIEVLVDA